MEMVSNSRLENKRRYVTHLLLALFTLASCYLTFWLTPEFKLARQLTIGLGYVALFLVVLTLLVGPWKLRGQRRNPVSFNLRRDIGIWAGITGLLHVLFGFQVHLGGQIGRFFFTPEGIPLLNLFGISNYVGALATLILALLLLLSNDLSLRWLKGKRWKFLQRFNYGLFVLVVAHTLGYQIVIERERVMILIAIGVVLLTLAAQSWGFFLYRTHQGQQTKLCSK